MIDKFSVLISVYDNDNPVHFKQALDSVVEQTCMPDQIILVLDGFINSDLKSVVGFYAENYTRIFTVLKNKDNQGPASAWNLGLCNCRNEIVARMDSDDICVEDRFEKQLFFLNNHPEVDVLGSFYSEFDASGTFAFHKLPVSHQDIYIYSKKRNPMCHPSVMYKKSAVLDSGKYIKIKNFVDYYLWVRMLEAGYIFSNVPEVLLHFRGGRGVMLRRGGIQYALNEYKFLKKCYEINHISLYQFITNFSVRFLFRMAPLSLRNLLYYRFLREPAV